MLLSEKNQESGEMGVTIPYTGEIQYSLNIKYLSDDRVDF